MSNDQKIIKNKLGLLKLAEMLGRVSQEESPTSGLLGVIAWTRPHRQRWRVSTYRTQIGMRLAGF